MIGKNFSKKADFWKTKHNFFPDFFFVNFSKENESALKKNLSRSIFAVPIFIRPCYRVADF
jgi:hypothetical protein